MTSRISRGKACMKDLREPEVSSYHQEHHPMEVPEGLPEDPKGLPEVPEGVPRLPEGVPGVPQGVLGLTEGVPEVHLGV